MYNKALAGASGFQEASAAESEAQINLASSSEHFACAGPSDYVLSSERGAAAVDGQSVVGTRYDQKGPSVNEGRDSLERMTGSGADPQASGVSQSAPALQAYTDVVGNSWSNFPDHLAQVYIHDPPSHGSSSLRRLAHSVR